MLVCRPSDRSTNTCSYQLGRKRLREADEEALESECQGDRNCRHCGCIISSRLNKSGVPRNRMTRFSFISINDSVSKEPRFEGFEPWVKNMLRTYHQFGFSEQWLTRLFRNLPKELHDALKTAVSAVSVLGLHAQQQAHRSSCNQVHDFIKKFATPSEQDEAPWLFAGEGMDDDEMLVFEDSDMSVIRYTFEPDPTSARGLFSRRTEAFVNKAACSIFGLHAEELLARICCNDMPEHLCEFDHLLMMVENLWSRLRRRSVQYFRAAQDCDGRKGVLLERSMVRRFDKRGLLWQVTVFTRHITPDDYDDICRAHEHSDGGEMGNVLSKSVERNVLVLDELP